MSAHPLPSVPLPASWRYLRHGPDSPARNMARDEALLRLIDRPVIRVYEWSVPAVSLGYFQAATVAPADRSFVRRYTGGGLVDHAHDVTYSLVVPRFHPWLGLSMPESYRAIHTGVQAALKEIGVAALLVPEAGLVPSPDCFLAPVRYDLATVDGRKLSGAAQRRTREGLLHQGSILLPEAAQNETLREVLAPALARALGFGLEIGTLTVAEAQKADELEAHRYSLDTWNRARP